MDKDRFRQDLGKVEKRLSQVLERVLAQKILREIGRKSKIVLLVEVR
jgi:uncharacterized protein YpuA (DUF1002 family)